MYADLRSIVEDIQQHLHSLEDIQQHLRTFSATLDSAEASRNRLWSNADVGAYLGCSDRNAIKWLREKEIPKADAPGTRYHPLHVIAAANPESEKAE